MDIMPEKSPGLAADRIYNGWLNSLSEVDEKNAKRVKLYQPPLPYPEFDINDILARTRKLAREYFEGKKSQNQNLKGTATAWEAEAIERLKSNFQYFLRWVEDTELKRKIEAQAWVIWPDMAPPCDLNKEELAKLVELQSQADELIENLLQATKDTLDKLYRLAQAERQIIADTAAQNMPLIHLQGGWFVNLLKAVTGCKWNDLTRMNIIPHAAEIERTHGKYRPRRWE